MQYNPNAQQVKELREKTGAGILDCRNALSASEGDIKQAEEWLRKKGVSNAHKKAGRATGEGVIVISSNSKKAVILELNSETDFVAKNDKFIKLAEDLGKVALDFEGNLEEFKNSKFNDETVADAISQHIAIIGENMQLSRLSHMKLDNDGVICHYMHNAINSNVGKIGVLVALESDASKEELNQLGRRLAIHIAAAKPTVLHTEDLDRSLIEKEKEIFIEQALNSGEPEDTIAQMTEVKIRNLFEEMVLLEQFSVQDNKTRIRDIIEAASKRLGNKIRIKGFLRFALGEIIDK